MSAKEKEPINFCALSCLCIIRNVLHLNLLVEALERYRASWGGVCVCVCVMDQWLGWAQSSDCLLLVPLGTCLLGFDLDHGGW